MLYIRRREISRVLEFAHKLIRPWDGSNGPAEDAFTILYPMLSEQKNLSTDTAVLPKTRYTWVPEFPLMGEGAKVSLRTTCTCQFHRVSFQALPNKASYCCESPSTMTTKAYALYVHNRKEAWLNENLQSRDEKSNLQSQQRIPVRLQAA